MEISETFRKIERQKKPERVDVRREAERMIKKHSAYLKRLKESAGTTEAFAESALQATETFQNDLKNFLSEHGAEDLYEGLVGFVRGRVSEIVSSSHESQAK